MIVRFLLGAIVFTSLSAFAEENMERIKVTGSHIKRLDQEGTSPVTVIDREQLNLSGAASLADVIRNVGVATSGVSRKTSLSDGNGASVTSFRGLPVGYVVILLNGKRIADSIDLNLIPKSSIERVEIIKDGASSIYGSDAIGGVMNFITKKGDVGAELVVGGYLPEPFVLPKDFLKYQGWRSGRWADVPQYQDSIFGFKGGESAFVEFTYGWSGDAHQSLLGVSFQRSQRIEMNQRPQFMATDADILSFSSFGSPGSYGLEGQSMQPMADCAENRIEDGICRFNYFEQMEYSPSVNTLSAFINTDLDLDDDNELFVQAMYALENSTGILAPPPDSLIKKEFVTVSGQESAERLQTWNNWTAALQTDASSGGLNLSQLNTLYYRLVDEKGAGQRKQDVNKHTFVLQAELTHYLSDNWSLNASINSSGYYQTMKGHNYALIPKLLELDGEGRAKFNPFRSKENKSDVGYATYNPKTNIMHAMTFFEGSIDGDLFSFGRLGTLSTAFGGRGGYEHWKAEFDEFTFDERTNVNNQWGGGSGEMGSGGRYWFTGYSEFVLPIQFSLDNTLELQVAGSVDYYQHAGVDANPKLAFKWMPGNIVQVRGSMGTGFKAPAVKYALQNYRVIDHPYGTDYRSCPEDSKNAEQCVAAGNIPSGQYEFTYFGNQNLKPEKSTFYNIGVGVEPVKNIFFGLDYFMNSVEDRLLSPQIDEVIQIARFHKDTFTDTFEKDYSTEIIDNNSGQLRALKSKVYNFGSVQTKGLEANLNMQLPVFTSSNMLFGAQAVYYLESLKKRPYLDEDFESHLGNWGVPVYVTQSHLGMKYKNGVQWFLTGQLTSRFNQSAADQAPDTIFQKAKNLKKKVLGKKEDIQKGAKSKVCEAYEDLGKVREEGAVCQVARHFNMDLNILFPLSLNTKLLFKVENVLNTVPPEHRIPGGNQQSNINGIRAIGFIPVGMYKGVNGRALTLQVNHKF